MDYFYLYTDLIAICSDFKTFIHIVSNYKFYNEILILIH